MPSLAFSFARNNNSNMESGIKLHNDEYVEPEGEFSHVERSFVFETRVDTARALWDEGKVLFREGGDHRLALGKFKLALHHVDFDELSYNFELMDKHRVEIDSIRSPLWVNCATCLCTLNEDLGKAVEYCDLAIKLDPANVKALFRRAKIRELEEKWDLAVGDLVRAQSLEPGNAQVRQALQKIRQAKTKEQADVDNSLWKGKALFPVSAATTTTTTTTVAEPAHTWWVWLVAFWTWIFYRK